jgi:hypothetical protein
MSRGEIIDFAPEHLRAIVSLEQLETKGVEGWGTDGTLDQALNLAKSGPAFSYRTEGGEVLAAAGAILMWPGVAWGWTCVDRRALEHPLAIVRAFRQGIDELFQRAGLWRLQSTVRADFTRSLRFTRAIGINDEEHLLKGFGRDGADHIMFARVKK